VNTWGSLLAVKWWGHEPHHSALSNAEVKKVGVIPPLPHMFSQAQGKLYLFRINTIRSFLFYFEYLRL
jgi:hypothetical protein